MRIESGELLRNLVVQLAGDVAPLLLLRIDEAARQLRLLGCRLAEILGKRVEDLADAIQFRQTERRQAACEVALRQPVQACEDLLSRPCARSTTK